MPTTDDSLISIPIVQRNVISLDGVVEAEREVVSTHELRHRDGIIPRLSRTQIERDIRNLKSGEFFRIMYHTNSVLERARTLYGNRELFLELAKKPSEVGSLVAVIKEWDDLTPLNTSYRMAHPALIEASKQFDASFQMCRKAYQDLDTQLEVDLILEDLEALQENVVTPAMALYSDDKFFSTKKLADKQVNEWNAMLAALYSEIRLFRQFYENRKAMTRVMNMVRQSCAMGNSKAQGVYRFTRYPEKITMTQQVDKDTTKEVVARIAEFDENKAPVELQFVATPTLSQTVVVNYSYNPLYPGRWSNPNAHGTHREVFHESSGSREKFIKELSILALTKDPKYRPAQIVDYAAKYLVNCRKDYEGQPRFSIELQGPHQLALKKALLILGVRADRIECKETYRDTWASNSLCEDESIDTYDLAKGKLVRHNELSQVEKIAKERYKEIQAIVNPNFIYKDGKTSLLKQLDRPHNENKLNKNPQWIALQQKTFVAIHQLQQRFSAYLTMPKPEEKSQEEPEIESPEGMKLVMS